jgi:hypothetical protein
MNLISSSKLPKIVDDYYRDYQKNIILEAHLLDQLVNGFAIRSYNILDRELELEEINLSMECAQYIGIRKSLELGLIKPKSKTRLLYELFKILINQPIKLEENDDCIFPFTNTRSDMQWHNVINNIHGNNLEIHQLRASSYCDNFIVDIVYQLEIVNIQIIKNYRWYEGTVDIKFVTKFLSKTSNHNKYTDEKFHTLNQIRGSEFHTVILNLDSEFMFLLNLE